MNRYPLWKYLLILVVLGLSIIYALPNLYAPDPAVQISGYSADLKVDQKTLDIITQSLDDAGVEYKKAELENSGSALIRLHHFDVQLKAQKAIEQALAGGASRKGGGDQFIVALNSAQNTPQWLHDLGASPMNLGLDLAGGVHFVLEVDTPKAVKDRLVDAEEVIKNTVRKERIFDVQTALNGDDLVITAPNQAVLDQLLPIVREQLPKMNTKTQNDDGAFVLRLNMSEQGIKEIEDHAVSQNLTTLRNRVNELGVAEPLVQRLGRNRIIVELPGVQDTARAKKVIGKTANLEFRLEALPDAGLSQREKFNHRQEDMQSRTGGSFLERRPIITGENVTNAQPGFDAETSQPQVNISLDSEGGAAMHRATWKNVGRRLGVLFIEYRPNTRTVIEADGTERKVVEQIPVKQIISLATVQSALGREFRTTGLSDSEAKELSLLLRAGALAAPMVFVEERTIGPSLGKENIALGVKSVQLGMLLVVLTMFAIYRVFGFAANIALAFNVVLIAAIMSPFATLTLPGLAGIVLTVGMAVDANVLIFSRIREELKAGMPPQSAINAGFDRAFTTILDANITTLIVALILFGIGSGPVKGFAVTLSIGILTSMFTAIVVTRAVVNLIYGGRQVTKLHI
ncbi:MAG: protein translocase subunit SecD [Marinagarivorans sp.]|nr:protein translocase subunit SecD [Marinagarivorans sp.]